MMELRRRFRKFRDIRTQVRNIAGFNIGGGTFDIDLALRGPRAREAGRVRRASLKEKARAIPGIVDADTTLQLDKPELRVVIDRERAADLRVDTSQIATALRLDGGRRRPGLALPRPHRQRRLRRADPADGRLPRRPQDDLAAVRLARLGVERDRDGRGRPGRHGAGRRPGASRQPGADRADADRVPHRPHRPAARDAPARPDRPGLRPGRPQRAAASRRWRR